MLVLDDPRRVVVSESDEVLLGARDVLAGDEELPERSPDPRLLRDARRELERPVDAEQRPALIHEREEARRGADDGVAEVPLALELARLAALRREVADDEHELVGTARDEPPLVLAGLALDVERVLDVLELALVNGLSACCEHHLRDVRREPLVDGVPDHVVGRREEVTLRVDLEPAVDAVGADPEDRVGDRGDERACSRVARRRPVEMLVPGRPCHLSLVARLVGNACSCDREAGAFRIAPPQAGIEPQGFGSCRILLGGRANGGGIPLPRNPAREQDSVQDERDPHRDAELGDLVVLDDDALLGDPRALDAVDGLPALVIPTFTASAKLVGDDAVISITFATAIRSSSRR